MSIFKNINNLLLESKSTDYKKLLLSHVEDEIGRKIKSDVEISKVKKHGQNEITTIIHHKPTNLKFLVTEDDDGNPIYPYHPDPQYVYDHLSKKDSICNNILRYELKYTDPNHITNKLYLYYKNKYGN